MAPGPETPLPPVDPLIGSAVGNLVITGCLGRGGMGAVYEARHPFLGREVAIKVLGADWGGDAELVARFRREALAANQVAHPVIVAVSDFGVLPDGRAYYVMERLRGRPLRAELEARGRLPPADALELLLPVVEALAETHAAGIVHRDLKPDNVFLQDDGRGGVRPRLLDFGIARLAEGGRPSLDGLTREGQVLGTPLYLPPEQARGALAELGPWSDVYALGAVLHHLLTGQPPYPGQTLMAVLLGHLEGPIPLVRALAPEVSPALEAVVQRCLAKAPTERFPDAAALGQALRAAVAVAPPAEVQAASRPRPTRTRRAGPWLAGIAGILAGAAVTALLVRSPGPAPSRPVPVVAAADAAARADGTASRSVPALDAAVAPRDAAPPARTPRAVISPRDPPPGRPEPVLDAAVAEALPRARPATPDAGAPPRAPGDRYPALVAAPAEAYEMLRRHAADLKRCRDRYVALKLITADLRLTLQVHVWGRNGQVTQVTFPGIPMHLAPLADCLRHQVRRLRYPIVDGRYLVEQGLTLIGPRGAAP